MYCTNIFLAFICIAYPLSRTVHCLALESLVPDDTEIASMDFGDCSGDGSGDGFDDFNDDKEVAPFPTTPPETADTGAVTDTDWEFSDESIPDSLQTVVPSFLPTPATTLIGDRRYHVHVMGTRLEDGRYLARVNGSEIELEIVDENSRGDTQTTERATSEAFTTEKNKNQGDFQGGLTEEIIERTLKNYRLNFVQYKTQLNLYALQGIIPVFQFIRDNMTSLQDSTLDEESYFKESQKLEMEMIQAEDQFLRTRALIRNSTTLHDSIHTELLSVHEAMINILRSQLQVFHPVVSSDDAMSSDTGSVALAGTGHPEGVFD